MKVVVAALMGLCSGLLIYFMAGMLFFGLNAEGPSVGFVIVTWLGGWALSTWLLVRNSRGTNIVFRRGFLFVAAEWLCMALVGIVVSARAVSSTLNHGAADSAAATSVAVLGGEIIGTFAGQVSFLMASLCLLSFAIAFFVGRVQSVANTEMQ